MPVLLAIVLPGLAAGAGLLAPTAPVDSHPLVVMALAAAVVGVTLVLARGLGLGRVVAAWHAPDSGVDLAVGELTDLSGLARMEGLLPVVGDPRARAYPLLRSGLHMLIRDADERLIRSGLETEMDRMNAGDSSRMRTRVLLCGILSGVLVCAAAGAAFVLAGAAGAPHRLGLPTGAAALVAILGGFLAIVLAGPMIRGIQQRTIRAAFVRLAELEAVEAIRLRETVEQAAARLGRLDPDAADGRPSVAAAARRAA